MKNIFFHIVIISISLLFLSSKPDIIKKVNPISSTSKTLESEVKNPHACTFLLTVDNHSAFTVIAETIVCNNGKSYPYSRQVPAGTSSII